MLQMSILLVPGMGCYREKHLEVCMHIPAHNQVGRREKVGGRCPINDSVFFHFPFRPEGTDGSVVLFRVIASTLSNTSPFILLIIYINNRKSNVR